MRPYLAAALSRSGCFLDSGANANRFYALLGVAYTCDGEAWRADYFGALFSLNPGGLVPAGPDQSTLISAPEPLR